MSELKLRPLAPNAFFRGSKKPLLQRCYPASGAERPAGTRVALPDTLKRK